MAFTGLTLAILSAGCFMPVNGKPSAGAAAAPVLPKPGPHQVLVDSRWAYSATENRPAPEWILDRARETAPQGNAGLDKLVGRWPDVTLEFLRQSVAVEGDLPLRLAIAESYDRTSGSTQTSAGWSAALAASDSRRDSYAKFQRAREDVLALFGSGRFAEASKINPLSTLPDDAPPALRTEALRLEGLAELLNNKPDRAAALFSQGHAAGANGPRHQLFEITLLESEAQRRSNQPEPSTTTWKAAVAAATEVRDPELWERAILAKPEHVDWPAEAAITGAGEPNFAATSAPDTANVLIGVGKMYLSRGAYQPALLAFSRAEAETPIPGEKALASLYRAQTMIALQQAASALPMLEGLLQCGDAGIARRAEAVQGDVLCRVLGDRQHGIPMMREALLAPGADWPGKAQLLANLGLYQLLEGRNEEGLASLHQAQAGFEARAQWSDLAAALTNEAAFLKHADKAAEAAVVQKRADEVDRKAGLAAAEDSMSRP
jgi:tetratricopeptide (TPR) repeat protein